MRVTVLGLRMFFTISQAVLTGKIHTARCYSVRMDFLVLRTSHPVVSFTRSRPRRILLAIRNPGGHSFPEGTEQCAIEYISLLSLLVYRMKAKRRNNQWGMRGRN